MKHELEIRKVLIIDDEPDIRSIMKRILEKQNIQADQAENGITGLELLGQNHYQAVLCDIMMPELNGLDCLAQAQARGILTPFIFVTGYSDEELMLQAIRLGAIDFISKPFNNNSLLETVFRVLEIGSRRDRMIKEMGEDNPNLITFIKKEEQMISLMRIKNNKK